MLSREFAVFRIGAGTPTAGRVLHWHRLSAYYGWFLTDTRAPEGQQLMLTPRAAMAVRHAPWVIGIEPGFRGACVHLFGDFGTWLREARVCGPLTGISRHGLAGITAGKGNVETLFGVVPDGNATVKAVRADGVSETVAVRFNAYVVSARGQFRAIDLRRFDGERIVFVLPRLASPRYESRIHRHG